MAKAKADKKEPETPRYGGYPRVANPHAAEGREPPAEEEASGKS